MQYHNKRIPVLLAGILMALTAVVPTAARGQAEPEQAQPDLVIVNMADTHSAYDAYPAVLAGVQELARQYEAVELMFLFNGDLFELGNASAAKSAGEADWVFFERLAELGSVVINIGNHEFDFMSPQAFVDAAQAVGAQVIGTVTTVEDASLVPVSTDLVVDQQRVRIVGVGTDQMNTYPAAIRESLVIPEPVAWLRANWQPVTEGADYTILASHAGLVSDLAMIDAIDRDAALLYVVGGHNHIVLREAIRGIDYMHNGFRGEQFNVTELTFTDQGVEAIYRDVITAEIGAVDTEMASVIEQVREQYLDADDLAVVGTVPRDMTVTEAALWAVETVRVATDADLALLNHTTFGSGLLAGPLARYRFDQFARFDNDIMRATVDAQTLRTILAGANQHRSDDVRSRTGDFLYTGPIDVIDGRSYDIVTSNWVAFDFNQARYLGTTVDFEQVPGITFKQLLVDELNR